MVYKVNISIGSKAFFITHSLSSRFVNRAKEGNEDSLVKRDSIMISEEARQRLGQVQSNSSSTTDNLMKQREKIQEMKSNLTERTLENGDDLSLIKDQLTLFDEQIAEIDEQIFALEAQNREKEQREQEEKQEKQDSTQSKESNEASQMTSLLQSIQSLEHVDALKRVKGTIERDHRRLKIELNNDASRGTFMESKAEKINDLAKRMHKLDSAMNTQLRKANESSDEMAAKQLVEEEEEVEVE